MDKKVLITHNRDLKIITGVLEVTKVFTQMINTETSTGYGCEMCTDLYQVYMARGYDVTPIVEFMNANNIPIPE